MVALHTLQETSNFKLVLITFALRWSVQGSIGVGGRDKQTNFPFESSSKQQAKRSSFHNML